MLHNFDGEFQFERKAYPNNNSNLVIMTTYYELKMNISQLALILGYDGRRIWVNSTRVSRP